MSAVTSRFTEGLTFKRYKVFYFLHCLKVIGLPTGNESPNFV